MLEHLMTNDYQSVNITALNDSLQYLDYLAKNVPFNEISVSPDLACKYEGNFFGLLKALKVVSPSLYLYTLYVNGYSHPVDYDGERLILKIPTKPAIPSQ